MDERTLVENFTPAELEELKGLLKLEAEMEEAKIANPIAWYKPLPAALSFHKCISPKRLNTGGNRSSKTYSGGAEATYWLRGHSPYRPIPKGPLEGVISSLNYDLFEATILPTLRELCPPSLIEIKWTINDKWVRCDKTGSIAYIKSDEQGWKSYQGRSLNFYWLDEEHHLAVFRQLNKRLKKGSILQAWFSMTAEPETSDHWTYDELALPALDKESNISHFCFDLEDNRVSRGGYLLDSEVDRMIKETPVDDRPAVIHGKYVQRGGRMYPMWDEKEHVSDELPMSWFLQQVSDGFLTASCWLDWGLRNPTAIGLVVEDPDGNCELIDEIYRPAYDVNDIKAEYQKRFARFRPYMVVADPNIWAGRDSVEPEKSVAGQFLADNRKKRLMGLPLVKGENSHDEGHPAVRDMLRVDPVKGPKFKVQPRCYAFRKEIPAYVGEEWVRLGEMKNKKETAKKKNDHHMDAFRYWCLSGHIYFKPRWLRIPVVRRYDPVTGFPVR